jgi:hypothetical protein
MTHAAIVIPVHRPAIKPLEALSLRRCQKILPGHPKFLVYPDGMDASAYRALLPGLQLQSFPAEFFRSDRGYNRLLRLPLFYDRFRDATHMLIYQADCYVFEDRLQGYLDRAYDYVGAPWLNFDWLREAAPWTRRVPGLEYFLKRVGNGGLSLRRVSAFRELAARFERLAERCDVHEDLYWCQLIARVSPGLRLASLEEALDFAFELEPERCYEMTGRRLPFGCHAFERYDFAFWRRHFDPEELRAAGFEAS